jgi:FKBP-type peptidyl-prolyl cis-trans isomerase
MRTPFLKPLGTAVLAVLAFSLFTGCGQQDSSAATGPATSPPIIFAPNKSVPVANIPLPAEPAKADLGDGLFAEFTTTKGTIIAQLEFEKTPVTVASFVGLAEGTKDFANRPKGKPYYDGLNFHRVIPDFMIQGGCPKGTGGSGPGYNFADETRKDLTHKSAGILSMANSDPQGSKAAYSNGGSSNGSQFFITHRATPHLDGLHTVFGHVVIGQGVVNAIVKGDKINNLKLIRNGAAATAFKVDEAGFKKIREAKQNAKQAKFEERMKKDTEQADALLASLKEKHQAEVITTKTGLRYIITQSGEGEAPGEGDKLTLNLKFTLADGTVVDDSSKNEDPLVIPVGENLRLDGLTEGIAGMKKGEHRTLVIPHKLGFGESGAGADIPPFATLIFQLEIIDVKSDKNLIEVLIAKLKKDHPKAELVTTKSGLRYVVTKAGAGEKVGNGKKIKAHYTGRLLDGTEFDSSVKRGVPFEFVVGTGQVIKGWDEALSDMTKGEKRTLIIPHALAYGERGRPPLIPPAATLVFDVELVDF